jgi:amiloride-sensitive sodium channel subunit gamma
MSITEENLNKTYNLTRKDVGYSLETMLISCFYNGIACNTSDFSLVFTYEYGNCYTFNSQTPARTTKLFGFGSGLVLELFVGVEGIKN